MRPIIEFCTNNTSFGTELIMKRLEQEYPCDVVEYGCLTGCGMCYLSPYALVNGETVEAETAEQLYGLLVEKIKEIQLLDD